MQKRNLILTVSVMLSVQMALGQSFMDRGFKALNSGHAAEAVRWFNWAVKADTTDASRYLARGHAERAAKDNPSAEKDLRRAIALDPNNGDAYFILALVDFDSGDPKTAIEHNTKAIENHTYYRPEAFLNRAESYAASGLNDEALRDYSTVISLNDYNLKKGYTQRAKLKLKLNDRQGALDDFKKVLELDSLNAQLIWDIGRLSYDLGSYKEAVDYYSKAIGLVQDKGPAMYLVRGDAYEKLLDYPSAIADYTRVIELKGDLSTAFFNRGQAKARSGDKKAACEDWKKAAELGNAEADGVIEYNCKIGRPTSSAPPDG